MKKLFISLSAIIAISLPFFASHKTPNAIEKLSNNNLQSIIDSLCKNDLPKSAEPYFVEAKKRAKKQQNTRWLLELIDKQIAANLVRFEFDDKKILDMLANDTLKTWTPLTQLLALRLSTFQDIEKRNDNTTNVIVEKCTSDSEYLLTHSAYEVVDSSKLLCDMSIYDYIALSIRNGNLLTWQQKSKFDENWCNLAKEKDAERSIVISHLVSNYSNNIKYALGIAKTTDSKALCYYYKAIDYVQIATYSNGTQKGNIKNITDRNAYADSAITMFKNVANICTSKTLRDDAKNRIADIERHELAIKTEYFIAPNTFVPIFIESRNVNTVSVRIFEDNEHKCTKEQENCDVLKSLKLINEVTFDIPICYHRLENTKTYYEMEGVPVGNYVVAIYDGNNTEPSAMYNFHSTHISAQTFTTDSKEYMQLTYAESGKPLDNAFVNGKKIDNSGWTEIKTKDHNSKITHNYDEVDFRDYYSAYSERATESTRAQIITDRKIYRPGQKIYFKAYIYNANYEKKCAMEANKKVAIKLMANNGSKIASTELVTNEFGSISGTFDIPTDVYKGRATITIEVNNDWIANESINIEEYKRSNNKLTFEPIRKAYIINDSVTVVGVATSADGKPLSNASVDYSVIYSKHPQKKLTNGKAITNNSGKFEIKFKPCYSYDEIEIKASIIDLSGEKTQNSMTCQFDDLGNKISFKQSKTYKENEDIKISIISQNTNNQPFATKAQININKIKNKYDFLPKIYESADTIASKDCSLNINNRRSGYTTEKKIFTKEINIDTTGVYELVIPKGILSSGIYQIELSALAANGKDTIKSEIEKQYGYRDEYDVAKFTIIGIDKASEMLPEIYFNAPKQMNFGEKAEIVIGSRLKNAQIMVVAEYGGEIIYHQFHECSASTKTIVIDLPSKPSVLMHDAVGINIACQKDNRYYCNKANIKLFEQEKPIDISISTSHDKSDPQQEENWELTINNDKPTEIVATMYDTRLDKIISSKWNTSFYKNTKQSELSSNIIRFNTRNIGIKNIIRNGWINGYKEPNFSIFYNLMCNGTMDLNKYSILRSRFAFNKSAAFEEAEVEDIKYVDSIVGNNDEWNEIKINETEQVRNDFRETVFFYPNLTPNEDGKCSFSFTLPDNITTYLFRALAHDKDMRKGYVQKTLSVSKKLIASLGLPRFAIEGDTINISGTITANDDEIKEANCTLSVVDTLTNTPIHTFASQKVKFSKLRNQQVQWTIIVPQNCSALKFKVTAYSGKYSDAELNTIRIEPRNIEIAESEPFVIMTKGQHSIKNTFDTETTISLSFNYTSNTFMEVLKALPHISHEWYESSDTYLGMMESSAIARYLMQKIDVQKAIEALIANDTLLKNALTSNAASTPWIYASNRMNQHNKEVVEMLKGNNAQNQFNKATRKLVNIQNSDGSFPWFKGMGGSSYLTYDILSTIGWMARYNLVDGNDENIVSICNKGKKYIIEQLEKLHKSYEKDSIIGYDDLHALYAYTYLTSKVNDDAKFLIEKINERWQKFDATGRIMATSILWRSGYRETAEIITQSLSENIVDVDEYSAHISNKGIYWFNSTLLTQSMLIMTLNEIRPDDPATKKLVNWLIMQKRSQWWSNTQSTSRAVMALLSQSADMSSSDTIKIDQQQWICSVNEPSINVNIEPKSSNATAQITKGNDVPSWGAWQRIAALPIDNMEANTNENLQIERIVELKQGNRYVPIKNKELKVGDEIRITLLINNNVDLDFVRICDHRAACLEPNNQLSGLTWDYSNRSFFINNIIYSLGRIFYYSPSDVDASFFIDTLKRGHNAFSYTTTIRQSGSMSSGYAEVECMYCPDIKAHTKGGRINIKK